MPAPIVVKLKTMAVLIARVRGLAMARATAFLTQWIGRFTIPLVLLMMAGVAGPLRAQPSKTPEYYFKAAFLVNFARLIEWPADSFENSQKPLVLCVLDLAPFGDALRAIDGKIVRGRKLQIVDCNDTPTLETCHILFANTSDPAKREDLIAALNGRSVLIVGEDEGFAQNEGMINFYVSKNKIHFEINQTRTEQAGLKISSRLLKLGRIVSSGDSE